MNLKEIQRETGTTPDGQYGPKTAAALRAAGYEVVIDAGHTSDRTREYPDQWPASAWQDAEFCAAARALGIERGTRDSVEHVLNCAVAEATRKALANRRRVLVYDDPALGNKAEYQLAAKVANGAGARVFLSLHANGSLGVDRYARNTACGTISYYRKGRAASARLALMLTEGVQALRAATGGPSNRADKTAATTEYHVLNATDASMASVLVEVGFYDHRADFCWMAGHVAELGAALAGAIEDFLQS